MNESLDENPYKSTEHAQPRSADPSPQVASTPAERLVAIALAIVVAIPVFFTTCIGGGFTLMALDVGAKDYGPAEDVLIVLSFVCLMFAIFVGVSFARWMRRRKRSKQSSGGETQ